MNNLLDILGQKARERPAETFLTGDFEMKRLSYSLGEIWEKSARIGSALPAC